MLTDPHSISPCITTIGLPGRPVSLSVLRLDEIHPQISGNKFFKLYYFLQRAMETGLPVITFGGAWSNHLYATAAACHEAGIPCHGIVRGEEALQLSPTLQFCREKGMKLHFISRRAYAVKESAALPKELPGEMDAYILIPEGGYSEEGMRGASLIAGTYAGQKYTHTVCACGTGTTAAGLIETSHGEVVCINIVKDDLESRIGRLRPPGAKKNYHIIDDYHFGGYAKKNAELLHFMNELYADFGLATDFIYTAKMMYAAMDLIEKNYFPEGSRILCIHSGGLQGNRSLPASALNF